MRILFLLLTGYIAVSFSKYASAKEMPLKWLFLGYFFMTFCMCAIVYFYVGNYEKSLWISVWLSLAMASFGTGYSYLLNKLKEKIENDKARNVV